MATHAAGQEAGLEHGHPDVAIEVISPSSRSKDSVRKLHDYASIGIPEYWLIDPEACTLERLVLREGTYSIVEALEGSAIFRPDGFEGLEIDLGRLWGGGEGEGLRRGRARAAALSHFGYNPSHHGKCPGVRTSLAYILFSPADRPDGPGELAQG